MKLISIRVAVGEEQGKTLIKRVKPLQDSLTLLEVAEALRNELGDKVNTLLRVDLFLGAAEEGEPSAIAADDLKNVTVGNAFDFGKCFVFHYRGPAPNPNPHRSRSRGRRHEGLERALAEVAQLKTAIAAERQAKKQAHAETKRVLMMAMQNQEARPASLKQRMLGVKMIWEGSLSR